MQHYETWGGYGASKAALDHLVLTFGAETGLRGVRRRPGRHAHPDAAGRLPGRGHLRPAAARDRGAARLLALLERRPPSRPLPSPPTSGQLGPSWRWPGHDRRSTERSGVRFHVGRGLDRTRRRRRCAGPPATTCACWSPAPEGIRHRRFARPGRGTSQPGDLVVVNNSATVNAEIDAVRDGRPVVLHVASRLDDGTLGGRAAYGARRRRPGPRRGARARSSAWASCALTLLAPYPREQSSPTGSGNRLWRAPCGGRPPRGSSTGTADRSPTATWTGATRSRPTSPSSAGCPGSAEMAVGRPTVHRRPGDAPGRARRPRRADHPAHRGLLAGGRRGSAAGVVPRARRHRAPRRARPLARRPRRGHRHHGHPRPRVSGRADGRVQAVVGLDRPRRHPGAPRGRRRRTDHRLARRRTPRTCCSSRRSRAPRSRRRRTTLPSPGATAGTSSATRRCSCALGRELARSTEGRIGRGGRARLWLAGNALPASQPVSPARPGKPPPRPPVRRTAGARR